MLVYSDMSEKAELLQNIPPLHHTKIPYQGWTELETMYQKIRHARNEGA